MPPGIGYGPMDPMDTAQAPLAMRMMEHMPGITASLMFAQGRGANTILAGGGYMDFERSSPKKAAKHRILDGRGTLTGRNAKQFSFGSKRAAEAAKMPLMQNQFPKMNFFGSSRLNHITMRPRAARRFHSLSVFSAANVTGAYTPFQAVLGLGRFPKTQNMIQSFVGDAHKVGPATMGPGLLSAMSAARRMDVLEHRAARSGKISPRMARKLEKFDRSTEALFRMNAPRQYGSTGLTGVVTAGEAYKMPFGNMTLADKGFGRQVFDVIPDAPLKGGALGPTRPGRIVTQAVGATDYAAATQAGRAVGQAEGIYNIYDDAATRFVGGAAAGPGLSSVGMRGDMLVSALPGATTRFAGGYYRTAVGKGYGLVGEDALEGRKKALKAIKGILPAGATDEMAEKFLESKLRGGAGIRAGMKANDVTVKAIAQNTAARNVMLTRGVGIGLRTANVLGTASLAYDLGKMAGEVVVSGINLARDAYKSVQGSINKPAFGMGYQDTEAAATSRARGVMAIQNSRLNARSVLGSEAGMMAAHFG